MQAKTTNAELYINEDKPPVSENDKSSYIPPFKPKTQISTYQEKKTP
jgi:hypothetical protein